MPQYPILMAEAMVWALLEGRKRQSRRIPTATWIKVEREFRRGAPIRLWVREAGNFRRRGEVLYRADASSEAPTRARIRREWTPSIHMPRWASRLTLLVTEVRSERLRTIRDADCEVEGATRPGPGASWREAFREVWNTYHRRSGERFEDNPEVIVLSFTVSRRNIDTLTLAE